MLSLSGLVSVVRNDLGKVVRFVAVSAFTVPLGMTLLWFFLQTDWRPFVANLLAVTLSTIPAYLLNRYWVWRKRGPNSVAREIVPFWGLAFLGLLMSTGFIWIAERSTDASIVFLAVNFVSFGVVWTVKFFVLERFMFGSQEDEAAEPTTA